MAKPIRSTPKLTLNETKSFLNEMMKINNSRVKSSDKKLAKEIISEFC